MDTELPLAVEEFLTWMATERGRSQNTLAAYRRDLNSYCEWLSDNHADPISVTADLLVTFIGWRRGSGAAASSIARQLAAIRMMHRFFVDESMRPDDPTADLDGIKVPAGIPKPLSEADVLSLLAAVTGDTPVSSRRSG